MTLRHRFFRWFAFNSIPWLIQSWCPCLQCHIARVNASPHVKEMTENAMKDFLEKVEVRGAEN